MWIRRFSISVFESEIDMIIAFEKLNMFLIYLLLHVKISPDKFLLNLLLYCINRITLLPGHLYDPEVAMTIVVILMILPIAL